MIDEDLKKEAAELIEGWGNGFLDPETPSMLLDRVVFLVENNFPFYKALDTVQAVYELGLGEGY